MTASAADDELGWLLLARQLARAAGDTALALRRATPESLEISQKSGAVDLVTRADHRAQDIIFSGIRAAYPTHGLIGEEGGSTTTQLPRSGTTWIVDGIDGTTNFVHGQPTWCVSIGVAVGRRPHVGVVYVPEAGEVYCAVRGRGAFLNDARLRVGGAKTVGDAVVISEWGYERAAEGVRTMLAVNQALLRRGVRGVRQIGSGALDLCYVAAGRADAVYCGVVGGDAWCVWDYAAAMVVAEEAGAVMRDTRGAAFDVEGRSMVCATPGLVDEVLEAIREGVTEGKAEAGAEAGREARR